MGTETPISVSSFILYQPLFVKLNNPLMGTETTKLLPPMRTAIHQVKLNNPLMGTETNHIL